MAWLGMRWISDRALTVLVSCCHDGWYLPTDTVHTVKSYCETVHGPTFTRSKKYRPLNLFISLDHS